MKLYTDIKNDFPEIEKLFSENNLIDFIHTETQNLYLYHFGVATFI